MTAHNAIIEFVRKHFKAVLSPEEAGELMLLFSYEIEANLEKVGAFEVFRSAYHKYFLQRKLRAVYS